MHLIIIVYNNREVAVEELQSIMNCKVFTQKHEHHLKRETFFFHFTNKINLNIYVDFNVRK